MSYPRLRLILPDWPTRDRAAWLDACRADGLLGDTGIAAHWKQKTKDTVLRNYGIWLAWLNETGRLAAGARPAARATREALASFLAWLKSRNLSPVTIAGRIRNLREAVRVMDPGADLAALDHLLPRLESVAHPVRNKGVRLVSPARLAEVGIDRMRRHRASIHGSISRLEAERYRDGLIIAFLAFRPLRLGNLAAIELDRHLQRRGKGYWCWFKAEETKDRQSLEFPLPLSLTHWIDLYLSVCRPALLRDRSSPRLWISMRSTPMTDNSIYFRVVEVTAATIGRPINPHLFRDCVATFIAEQAPEQIRIVSRILGHATLESAEDHYNQAGSLSAQARYLDALAKLRDSPMSPKIALCVANPKAELGHLAEPKKGSIP